MGLNQTELQEHTRTILKSRRIQNKVVILCEGSIQKLRGRRSPSSYREMETMPDSSFYRACVPREWRQLQPQFFNCGDRHDVISTYFSLKKLHEEDASNSYLDPEKLFAIVDLDLQIKQIEEYQFGDTEEIHKNLYQEFSLKENIVPHNRIFTTGLIYKEAYFLIPELQTVFSQDGDLGVLPKPKYQGQPLQLINLYKDMVENLNQDQNLKDHLTVAANRLAFSKDLDFTDVESLTSSLKQKLYAIHQIESCAYEILSISKIKTYWNALEPEEEFTSGIQNWREQLIQKIGRFYSTSINPRHHISGILQAIYTYYYT